MVCRDYKLASPLLETHPSLSNPPLHPFPSHPSFSFPPPPPPPPPPAADTTGECSVYTGFKDTEVMFHVSTLLPHTASNKQQLLRKRHIGNDIVTIIFQEPGCEQFSPRCIRSHFQHIFVIVRVENPNTKFTKYR